MKVLSIRNSSIEQVMPNVGITPVISLCNLKKGYTESDQNKLVEIAHSSKPDFFFFLKDTGITRNILQRIKLVSPRTKFVMWYGDFRNGLDTCISDKLPFIDALLITNADPTAINRYKSSGINKIFTFYHGVPLDEFQAFNLPITHQVFFGGNNFEKGFPLSHLRLDLINKVNKNFKLLLYGHRWPFRTNKPVPRKQYAKVLRSAYINLGINHYNAVRYYNRRLFECMASGRGHFTYYVPGMEKDFLNHKNIVWFSSVSEGIRLIKYYLNHKKELEVIGKNARSIIYKRHSYESRVVQLKGILESL